MVLILFRGSSHNVSLAICLHGWILFIGEVEKAGK
jgi:hypothetical protein